MTVVGIGLLCLGTGFVVGEYSANVKWWVANQTLLPAAEGIQTADGFVEVGFVPEWT